MAALLQQEREQRVKDIASGVLISGAQMRERLGISQQALTAALKAKRLFAIKGPSGKHFYPAFFAEEAKYGQGTLGIVCKELGDMPAGCKWDFFTSARHTLRGKNFLDALAKGKVDAVLNSARAFREE
jgi:hypothetical protein